MLLFVGDIEYKFDFRLLESSFVFVVISIVKLERLFLDYVKIELVENF